MVTILGVPGRRVPLNPVADVLDGCGTGCAFTGSPETFYAQIFSRDLSRRVRYTLASLPV